MSGELAWYASMIEAFRAGAEWAMDNSYVEEKYVAKSEAYLVGPSLPDVEAAAQGYAKEQSER